MAIKIPDLVFDDGKVIFTPSQISKLVGFGSAKYDTGTQRMANGISRKTGTTVSPRLLELEVTIDKNKADYLQMYFDGRHEIKVTFGDRYIFGSVETSALDYRHGLHGKPVLILDIYCPDPRFFSVDTFSKNLAGVVPLFGFPWRATKTKGLSFGYRQFSNETFYTNEGREPVGFKMKFIATRGDAENITITNPMTGEFISTIVSLTRGDTLLVSTTDEDMNVYLNDVNISDKVTSTSDFWQLQSGDNLIQVEALNETNLDIWLDFQSRFSNGLVVSEVV